MSITVTASSRASPSRCSCRRTRTKRATGLPRARARQSKDPLMANEAYIVGAVRTPTGRKKGSLAAVHGADLGAHAIKSLIERSGVDPGQIDDVIFGCVDQVGPLAGDIARTCWLAAGLPEHVPGTTVDRQCGSSQQAVHFAAQAVMAGVQDVVVAGGVQQMSQIPIASSMAVGPQFGFADPFSG